MFNETEFEVLDVKRKEMIKACNDFKLKKIQIKYKLAEKLRNQVIKQVHKQQNEFEYEYSEQGIGRSKDHVGEWLDKLPKVYTKEQLYPNKFPEKWSKSFHKGDGDKKKGEMKVKGRLNVTKKDGSQYRLQGTLKLDSETDSTRSTESIRSRKSAGEPVVS